LGFLAGSEFALQGYPPIFKAGGPLSLSYQHHD